jgi:hypothetical protein
LDIPDPQTPERRAKPRQLDAAEIGAIAHLYRGEVYRSTIWRTRLDTTTNWSVVTLGVALSISYAAPGASPLPLVLVGVLVIFFLVIEARRYRYFNVWRGHDPTPAPSHHRLRLSGDAADRAPPARVERLLRNPPLQPRGRCLPADFAPQAVILSGGPDSVTRDGAPRRPGALDLRRAGPRHLLRPADHDAAAWAAWSKAAMARRNSAAPSSRPRPSGSRCWTAGSRRVRNRSG